MELISLKQIASHYGVTPKTFARRVRAEGIPYTPFGRSMRFDKTEVQAYLRSKIAPPVTVKYTPVRKGKNNKLAEALGL